MKFRIVRQFSEGLEPSKNKAYRVETTELLTENEAFKLLKELGSPYAGRKYEETEPVSRIGSEVKTRNGTFPSIPFVKQADGSWKPKY